MMLLFNLFIHKAKINTITVAGSIQYDMLTQSPAVTKEKMHN